jgi:Transposase domain (DUF772)
MAILPPVLRAGSRELPDVPPIVQWLIGEFLTPILAWLETLVYRPLLRRCAEHPLVLLVQWYDPAAVVAAGSGFHHAPPTPGRPPEFTIAQFVRAEIVRAWADRCSDPALEELLSTNLLVRWFVGLPLSQPGPDHSTLADFHAYLTAHAPDAAAIAMCWPSSTGLTLSNPAPCPKLSTPSLWPARWRPTLALTGCFASSVSGWLAAGSPTPDPRFKPLCRRWTRVPWPAPAGLAPPSNASSASTPR